MPSAHGESHRTINRIAATLQHVEEGSDLRVVNHGFLERFFASNGAASLCAIAKLRNSASNQVSSERRSSSEGAQKAKPVFYAVRERNFCPKKRHNLSCSDLVSVHFRPGQFRKNQPEKYSALRVTCKLADLGKFWKDWTAIFHFFPSGISFASRPIENELICS